MGQRRGRVGGILFVSAIAALLGALFVHASPAATAGSETGRARQLAASECESCHLSALGTGHPVGVRPRAAFVPADWPLSRDGRVDCATCHLRCGQGAPREAGTDGGHTLRGGRGGFGFCQSCHVPSGSRSTAAFGAFDHAAFHPVAHPALARGAAIGIDEQSRRCLGCHDGTVGSSGDVSVARRRGAGGDLVAHPIGVPYRSAVAPHREGGFVPRSRLDPRILLPGERVGCLSCHDLYSGQRYLLVMSNDESALCLSCHDI